MSRIFMQRLEEALRAQPNMTLRHYTFGVEDIPEQLRALPGVQDLRDDLSVTAEYSIMPGEPRTSDYPGSGPHFSHLRLIASTGMPIELPEAVMQWLEDTIMKHEAYRQELSDPRL